MKSTDKYMKPKEINKRLSEIECFGPMAIREICFAMLENQEPDKEQLLAWADALLEGADRAYCTNDNSLTCTYLFLFHNLWDYAKNHLNAKDYHSFCGKQLDYWQYLYYD